MTTKEEQTINKLLQAVSDLRSDNLKFRESTEKIVQELSAKVDKKHMPLYLEQEVVATAQRTMAEALSKVLTDSYNSPLKKYADNVVSKYQGDIEAIFDQVVSEGLKTDEFKVRVREILLHKIAKTMSAGVDGSIDKTVNAMKQDAVFRSRLTLAINGLVEEFLSKPK